MTLAPGTRVGVYEVTALLGAGGMGEVYRARDPRLQRDVALKILPDIFAADPDRLARFQREAQVLASLAHPNIGHIYGLEESGTSRALVLELIEGPTLADRIARGPIAIEEALPIARQIADALDAAHEHGVIHRDLKPANIKVRDDGTVKVLDFGLAKLAQAPGPGPQALELTASPTMSAAFTGAGVILGTAAYMAPEQARGRAVDKRADIWAFGCVLFEMLAGKRAFDGTDATEMIAAVVRAEPDWAALPADTPPGLRALLRRCLEKDPKLRLRDIGDARFELDELLRAPRVGDAPDTGQQTSVRPARRYRALIAAAGGLVLATLGGYVGWSLQPEPRRAITRFSIGLPDGQPFTGTGRHIVAMSPTGTHLAFSAGGRIYLRALDQLEPVAIRGTESGVNPFFSPDGQWIGFWQSGQLKKISVMGGAAVTICAARVNPLGASWGADDMILFGQAASGIMRVPATGGTPEVVIAVEPQQDAQSPHLLPDGRTVLFTLRAGGGSGTDAQIVVQSLDTGERKVLVSGGSDARYLPTGRLVYAVEGTLFVAPFDPDALEVTGGAVPLVEDVAGTDGRLSAAAQFATAADGALAYVTGFFSFERRHLVWVDRRGEEEPIKAPPRAYRYPRLSPDGTRVLLDLRDEQFDIWIWHLAAETLTRLTLDPANEQYPVWATDRYVVFGSPRAGGASNLYRQAADGTGAVERLTESPNFQFPFSVSPDGTQLVFTSNSDLMLLPLQGNGRPQPLVQTPFNEINGEISPDGRWLAYESNESGRFEIYVRPFPDVNGGRWQVSTAGGTRPLWARSGRELFYVTPAGDTLMQVEVSGGPAFKAGTPTKLLDTRAYYFPPTTTGVLGSPGRMYDASPDGRRFLMIKQAASDQVAARPQILVVQNWLEELKRRVPAP